MPKLKVAALLSLFALSCAAPWSGARAARLVNTVNFGFNAFGCAIVNGNGNIPGSSVFLDSTCSGFHNQEWAIVRQQIFAEQLLTPLARGCLDSGSASPVAGTAVVVNNCNNGTGFQVWVYGGGGARRDKLVNVKSGLCLDTRLAGPSVTQVVLGDCAAGGSGQSWFVE